MVLDAAPPLDRMELGDARLDQLRDGASLVAVARAWPGVVDSSVMLSSVSRCVAHVMAGDLERKGLVSSWIIRVPRLILTAAR